VILDLQEKYHPEATYCCWEASGSVGHLFGWEEPDRALLGRRNIDPNYKAGRSPWPQELVDLVGEMMPVLSQMGVTHAWCDDEADDAIAALVTHCPRCAGEGKVLEPAEDHGGRCARCDGTGSPDLPALVWSADKDMLQLVRPGVSIIRDYRNSDKTPITRENIVERTGLTPEGWTAYLSLAGDASDGIKHPEKIGDKRARAIIRWCPDILAMVAEGRINDAARLVAANDAALMKHIDRVFDQADVLDTAHKLVRLRPDSPLHFTPPTLARAESAAWYFRHDLPDIGRRLTEPPRDPWAADERDW
jgi:5'-3' exonuclease